MTEEKAQLSIKKYWRLLVDYLKPQKLRVSILATLLLGGIALQLINPQIVRLFLDQAETKSGLDRLLGAAALFMGIALLHQVIQIAVTYLGENVAWVATNMLRADLALHCLKLDMSFHKRYKPGELIERVDGDVNQLANFFSELVLRLGGNLLLVAGVLVILGLQEWRIGLLTTVVAGIGVFILDRLNRLTIPRWQALREADAQLFGFLEEWLNGTEEIRSSGAEEYILLRLYQAMRLRWQKILAAMRIQVLVADLPHGVFALAYVVAHILGNTLFREGQMTIGQVYLIFYYLEVIKEPLWEILRQVEDLQRAAASINRISELRQVQPTIRDGLGVDFPPGPLGVAFEEVCFQYEDDLETNVLQNIAFRLQPGTVLGLLGRTGSGKSTLTRLLFRFHDPSSGVIRLGGDGHPNEGHTGMFDLRQATQSQLRQRIGMVTQEVQLFQATVRQNLTLFDDQISDGRIMEVVIQIGLQDWLASQPQGLDTLLEAGGKGLSAGEAQLLAFGRVFLSDPGLVILDEASSRLDPVTEQRIEKVVEKLLENRTGIIIAHRLGTVQKADEIMILNDGRIAEHGRREELARDQGSLFYRLLQTGLEEVMA
ncbi:MAG TPA: ABC transporter ATP-binding protein [Anaerolineales bacterium]|nr:ABC transporter ATP-binding protein [Anaerolineales bacterium]